MKRYILVLAAAMAAAWCLGADKSYTPKVGDVITLTADSADCADVFEWYKDGVLMADSTKSSIRVKVADCQKHTYNVKSGKTEPQLGNNMFDNGSFETQFSNPANSHFGSDYQYMGWLPEDLYCKNCRNHDLFFISENAQASWGDYNFVKAYDGQYFAVFDAGESGRAWYANTTSNPNLKLKKGKEYVFSYSAVNLNRHNSTNPYEATYDNPNNWSQVYCYIWDKNNNKILGNWPGTKATKQSDGKYHVSLPSRPQSDWKIIWNNNNGAQTGDATFSYLDTIDFHPAKLVFKVKNLKTNTEYPLATLDLDCHKGTDTHKWVRKQATFVAAEDMDNVEINVTDVTMATMGNDFGLDYLIFQMNNYDNSRPMESTNFVITPDCSNDPSGDPTEDDCDATLLYTKWSNLVLCANRDNDFVGYQWYNADNTPIAGATGQYYLLPENSTAAIYVVATRKDGSTVTSCPKTFDALPRSADEAKKLGITTAEKRLVNGQVLIFRDGRTYDVLGNQQ